MGKRGAEFAEIEPRSSRGIINSFQTLSGVSEGLDNGEPFPIIQGAYALDTTTSPNPLKGLDAFRIGQQILFWIGIANPIFMIDANPVTANWITSIQLKPWWLRPNLEYRAPGFPISAAPFTEWTGLDAATFLLTGVSNNKYAWIPSPKRLDITQYQIPPPTASPVRNSDSLMLDDVWKWELQDPNDAAYIADFPAPQIVSRWSAFFYPAMGYSLAFTWAAQYAFVPGVGIAQPEPMVSVTYALGTLGGSVYQDSIG
jgi:hypothetical protein